MGNSKGVNKVLLVILLLLIIAAVGVFYYYFSHKSTGTSTITNGQTAIDRDLVTIASHGDITGIYPEGEDDTITFQGNRHFFEPLVSFDKNLRVKGVLAESWTTDPTDNLTWRFILKKNVTFHDGTPFTANDVKFSLDSALKNEWSSVGYLVSVASTNVIDDQTVDIKTKEPDPILLNLLANVLIVSKDYQKGGTPNGTGPYKYVEWIKGDHLTLAANPNYYGGEPKVKKVIFKFIESENDRVAALLQGQADIGLYGVEENATDQIKANQALVVKTANTISVSTLFFNSTKENSPFKNLKVRQAVYHALDPTKLTSKLVAGGEPATQIVSKIIFGYNDDIERLSYDPEISKQLLKEAGYNSPLEFTLDDAKGTEKLDQEIADELNAAGFKVNLSLMEQTALLEKVFEKQESICLRISWTADSGDASTLGSLFHTPDEQGTYGAVNIGYSNAAVDKLIEDSAKTFDQAQRKTLLQQALKALSDDTAYVPLYVPRFYFGVDKNLIWEPRPDRFIFAFEMAGKK